jgi:VWFA-related protein
MAHPVFRLLPVVLVSFGAASPLSAAQAQKAKDARPQQVYVSVVDSRGAPITGLTAADFVVREDGATRELLDARPAEEPLTVALLIDDSEATRDATVYLREGLAGFLERLQGKGEVALITTGERPTVLAAYSAKMDELQQHVKRIFPRPGAGAYLLDAIIDASRGLARRESVRRTIVAVSFEGVDFSNRQYQQVLDELQKSGAALHVLAVGSPSTSLSDEMRNRNIAIAEGTERTGGRRDQVLALSGLPDKLKQAADELVNQYVLTYQRPEALIPPQKIEVATTRRGATARARTRLGAR